MKPLPLIDDSLFISASFIDAIQACSRYSQFYKIDNRISVKEKPALTFGKHIHTALEALYRLQEFKLSEDEIRQRVSVILTKAFEEESIVERLLD